METEKIQMNGYSKQMNKYTTVLFASLLLCLLCTCQNNELPSRFDKEALSAFYKVEASDLKQVFQDKLKAFDEAVTRDSNIQILQDATLKDSFILKSQATKTKLTFDFMKASFYGLETDEKIYLEVSQEDFSRYYQSIYEMYRFNLLLKIKGLYEFGVLSFKDKSLLDFVEKEYVVLSEKLENKERNKNYLAHLKLFLKHPGRLDEMETILDTLSARGSWGKHMNMLYLLAVNGRAKKAFYHFNRLVLETVVQKDDPFFIDYGITEIQHEELMFEFIRSEHVEVRSGFIQLAFDLLRNNSYGLDKYSKLPRILINSRTLSKEEETELLEILKHTDNFHAGIAGRDYKWLLENVNILKKASPAYIKDTLTTHQFYGIIKADLTAEDIKYIDEFLDQHHEYLSDTKNNKSIKGKEHFLKKYLTTPFGFESIKTEFAKVGIVDTTSLTDFVKHYESKDKSTFLYQPFYKYTLIDYIVNNNIPNVYFSSKSNTWPVQYKEILWQFSKGFEQAFNERLHFFVDQKNKPSNGDKNSSYVIYIFTDNSDIYKIDLGEARNLVVKHEPLLEILNTILLERKSRKRWLPSSNSSYTGKYWLMEPAAFEFLDDKFKLH